MKNLTGWFAFVLLAGVAAGFAAGKGDVAAQTVDNKTTRFLAGTVAFGQAAEAFVLFDSQTNRLAAYAISGNKRLEVLAVREVSWDLKPVAWGKQEPTVQEMKDAFEKAEKERIEKEKTEKK